MAYDPSVWTTRSDKHAIAETARVLAAYHKGKPTAFVSESKHGKACNAYQCKCPKIVHAKHSALVALKEEIVTHARMLAEEGTRLADLPQMAADTVRRILTPQRRAADCTYYDNGWCNEEEYMRRGGYERAAVEIMHAIQQAADNGKYAVIGGKRVYASALHDRRSMPGLQDRIDAAHIAALEEDRDHAYRQRWAAKLKAQRSDEDRTVFEPNPWGAQQAA